MQGFPKSERHVGARAQDVQSLLGQEVGPRDHAATQDTTQSDTIRF